MVLEGVYFRKINGDLLNENLFIDRVVNSKSILTQWDETNSW